MAPDNFKIKWQAEQILYVLFFLTGPLLFTYRNVVQVTLFLIALYLIWHLIKSSPHNLNKIIRSLKNNSYFALVPVIAIVSILWSINKTDSAEYAVQVSLQFLNGAVLLAGLAMLDNTLKQRAIQALAWGFVVAGLGCALYVLGFYILASNVNDPINHLNLTLQFDRGTLTLSILAIPLGLVLWHAKQYKLAIVLTVVALLSLTINLNMTARVTFVIAGLTAAAVYILPVSRFILYASHILIIGFLPWLIPSPSHSSLACAMIEKQPSMLHRLAVWEFAEEAISQRPILGHGIHSSRYLGHSKEKIDLSKYCPSHPSSTSSGQTAENIPMHPHNAVIQIWLELGVLGAISFALTLGMAYQRTEMIIRTKPQQSTFSATIAAALVVAMSSFGLWQGWFIATLFLIAGTIPLSDFQSTKKV